jgi:hypothetical protein
MLSNPVRLPGPTYSPGITGIGNVSKETNSSAIPNHEGKRSLLNETDEYVVQFGGVEDNQDPRHFTSVRKWTIVVILSLTSASV